MMTCMMEIVGVYLLCFTLLTPEGVTSALQSTPDQTDVTAEPPDKIDITILVDSMYTRTTTPKSYTVTSSLTTTSSATTLSSTVTLSPTSSPTTTTLPSSPSITPSLTTSSSVPSTSPMLTPSPSTPTTTSTPPIASSPTSTATSTTTLSPTTTQASTHTPTPATTPPTISSESSTHSSSTSSTETSQSTSTSLSTTTLKQTTEVICNGTSCACGGCLFDDTIECSDVYDPGKPCEENCLFGWIFSSGDMFSSYTYLIIPAPGFNTVTINIITFSLVKVSEKDGCHNGALQIAAPFAESFENFAFLCGEVNNTSIVFTHTSLEVQFSISSHLPGLNMNFHMEWNLSLSTSVTQLACATNNCEGDFQVCTVDNIHSLQCSCPLSSSSPECSANPAMYTYCLYYPCINGGECNTDLPTTSRYECQCPKNFTGLKCEEDVNECTEKNPCFGGDCINTIGSFECECREGYYGELCREEKSDMTYVYAIIGALAGLGLIIGMYFIVTCILRRRRGPPQSTSVFHTDEHVNEDTSAPKTLTEEDDDPYAEVAYDNINSQEDGYFILSIDEETKTLPKPPTPHVPDRYVPGPTSKGFGQNIGDDYLTTDSPNLNHSRSNPTGDASSPQDMEEPYLAPEILTTTPYPSPKPTSKYVKQKPVTTPKPSDDTYLSPVNRTAKVILRAKASKDTSDSAGNDDDDGDDASYMEAKNAEHDTNDSLIRDESAVHSLHDSADYHSPLAGIDLKELKTVIAQAGLEETSRRVRPTKSSVV